MLGTVTDPSKRAVSKGLLCLRLLLLGLLAALVLASSAYADQGETAEAPAVAEEQAAPPPEETQAPAEPTPEGGEAVAPPVEETVVEVPPAPVEETIQVTLPPPVEEVTQVIAGVEEAVEQPIKQVTEAVQQQVGGSAGSEETSKGSTTSSSSTGLLASNTEALPGEVAGTAAGSTSTNSMAPLAVEASGPSDPGEPPAAAGTRGSERSGLGCQVSVLGNSLSQGCAAGWLGASNLAPSVTAAIEDSSTSIVGAVVAASAATGNGGDNDSPAIGNRPVTPAPGGSAPSGSGAGAVGVGSAGGLGLSAFLTIAGLLLLAAPHAMRRLRLSCLPWRTSFFVLIPERPG
jgi:outer membrane biosynthesis protein TonB